MPPREDTTKEEQVDLYLPTGAPAPYLIVITSPSSSAVGRMYRVTKDEIVLGRGIQSDILVDDDGVSRYHAKIVLRGDKRVLIDLDSTNGTFLNGAKAKEAVLQEGDKIQMGRATVLKYTVQDALDETYHRELYDSAVKDGLTGVHNRRYFLERLKAEFQHSQRHKRVLSLMLFDLDYFKKVNDTHGHRAGDAVLRTMAEAVAKAMRGGDVFSRIGGEEFACILRETDHTSAVRFAERLRKIVKGAKVRWGQLEIEVTISIGIATFDGTNYTDPEAMMQAADEKLYAAKNAGRDRVEG
ncbi:MAG TPA: diguanylate cyclase [bacterium]|nr:diguanylate cyclase [bacterium]